MYYSKDIYKDELSCVNMATYHYLKGNIGEAIQALQDRLGVFPNSPISRSLLDTINGNPTLCINPQDKHIPKSGLKYAIFILATENTPELRATVNSIINSDYTGEIYLTEDGDSGGRRCELLCSEHGIRYIKQSEWINAGNNLISSIKSSSTDADIIITTHSDVLFPPRWFYLIDDAWSMMYSTNKAAIINTQYCGYIGTEASHIFKALFNSSLYYPLEYMCTSLRECVGVNIRYIANRFQYYRFGLGRCEHNDNRCQGRIMPTIVSPMYSSRKDFLYKMKHDSPISSEGYARWALQAIKCRMWILTMTTPFWIHQAGTDVNRIVSQHGEYRNDEIMKYSDVYGFDAPHALCKAYSGVYIGNESFILDAVNKLNFEVIEPLFDIMIDEILNGNCDDCDIHWCQARGHEMKERRLDES